MLVAIIKLQRPICKYEKLNSIILLIIIPNKVPLIEILALFIACKVLDIGDCI